MRQPYRLGARARGSGLVALLLIASAPTLVYADEAPRLIGHTITTRHEVGIASRLASGFGSNEFGIGRMLDLHAQLALSPRFTVHAGLPMGRYGFEYDHDFPDVNDGESVGNLGVGGRMRWELGAEDRMLLALGATVLLPTGADPMEIRNDPRHPRHYAQSWMYWHRPYALSMHSFAAGIQGDLQRASGESVTQIGLGVWSALQDEGIETAMQGSVGQNRDWGSNVTATWELLAALSPGKFQGGMGAFGLGYSLGDVMLMTKGSLALGTAAGTLALDVSLTYAWF